MASNVIKKGGAKEPFNPDKIKNAIRAAASMTDLSEEKKDQVMEQVTASILQLAATKEEISTSELRDKILTELDRVEPSVSKAWREYDQQSKGV